MQKVAEVAPAKYEYITKMASVISQGPFAQETVAELSGILKKAGAMGGFGNAMAGIGAAVGTGIAMSLAGDLFEATKRGVTKSLNYRRMMKENPDLAKEPAHKVQQAFSTLHRFNSDFSGDPTVAGAFVRKSMTFADDMFNPDQLSKLVSSKKTLTDQKRLPIPGNLPWESLANKKHQGLQTQKLEQDIAQGPLKMEQLKQQTDPEFQRAMREPDAFQQNLWQAQTGLANQQRQKILQEKYRSTESPGRGNKRQNQHRP